MTFDYMGHETHPADLRALQALAEGLQDSFGTVYAVEIGSWAGLSALALSRVCDRVFCVDHWRGNVHDRLAEIIGVIGQERAFATFCRNLGPMLGRKVFPCVGDSATWAAIWPFPVELCFIDGEHTYEAVSRDIDQWWPHVRPGGVMCGHDYCEQFPGVVQAVGELVKG